VLRLSPAMKRQNRTQQEGPRNREIATMSMINVDDMHMARDQKGSSKTCQ
jgi:hypothetical protein